MKAGRPARFDYEYKRNGTANLFMKFAPLEGWRHVKVTDRHTAADYAHVLKDLADVHFANAGPLFWFRTISIPAEVVMADTAYDADHLRQAIAAKGALAVIPNNPSRALKYPLDKHLYAQRHLVECCFSKLKQFRRVATRFEKTARNYRAVVTLAAIILWMR
jgi:transposase